MSTKPGLNMLGKKPYFLKDLGAISITESVYSVHNIGVVLYDFCDLKKSKIYFFGDPHYSH